MLDKCHTMVTTLECWAAVTSRGLLLPVPVSGDTWHVAAVRMGCRLTCLTNNQRQEPAHRKHYFRHQTNRVNCQAKWEGGAGLQGQWSICCLLTVQVDIYTRYLYFWWPDTREVKKTRPGETEEEHSTWMRRPTCCRAGEPAWPVSGGRDRSATTSSSYRWHASIATLCLGRFYIFSFGTAERRMTRTGR